MINWDPKALVPNFQILPGNENHLNRALGNPREVPNWNLKHSSSDKIKHEFNKLAFEMSLIVLQSKFKMHRRWHIPREYLYGPKRGHPCNRLDSN